MIELYRFRRDKCDETMLRRTLGIGKADFGGFSDLQVVSEHLGYQGYGLASMAKLVFGTTMAKAKKVSEPTVMKR